MASIFGLSVHVNYFFGGGMGAFLLLDRQVDRTQGNLRFEPRSLVYLACALPTELVLMLTQKSLYKD